MSLRNAVCLAGASELATVLVVRKKGNRNKKTSHLILEMWMNEAGDRKKYNMPDVNELKWWEIFEFNRYE